MASPTGPEMIERMRSAFSEQYRRETAEWDAGQTKKKASEDGERREREQDERRRDQQRSQEKEARRVFEEMFGPGSRGFGQQRTNPDWEARGSQAHGDVLIARLKLDLLKLIVQFHPDKNPNGLNATRVTAELNRLRDAL